MLPRPPRSSLTDTRLPYTTHFRSVRQEGMSFKLKAKLIAEENLREVFKLTRDEKCPPQVRGKLIELTARWAGFDPRTNGEDAVSGGALRSEEHTSELQSLMRISYAVFCLKKKKTELIRQLHK